MVKYFFVSLVVFLISGIWLFTAISRGNATYRWTPTPATIGIGESDSNLRGRRTAVYTPVTYMVDGVEYHGMVESFLVPGTGTVYVNPSDPTQVAGEQGPNLQHYGRPMVVAIGSGLFLIVLGLIAFSPKEE